MLKKKRDDMYVNLKSITTKRSLLERGADVDFLLETNIPLSNGAVYR